MRRILAILVLASSLLSLASLALVSSAATLGPYFYNDTVGYSGYWYLYGYAGELAYEAKAVNFTLSIVIRNILVNVTASNLTLVNATINKAYLVLGGTIWERYDCHEVCSWYGSCNYECSTDYYHIVLYIPMNIVDEWVKTSYLYSSTNHTYQNITIMLSGYGVQNLDSNIIFERMDTKQPAISLSYYMKQLVPLPGLGAHVSGPIQVDCNSITLTNTFSQPVNDSLCLAQLTLMGIALDGDAVLAPRPGANKTFLPGFVLGLEHPLFDVYFSGNHSVLVIYRDLEYNSTSVYNLFNSIITNGRICYTTMVINDGNLTLYPCSPRTGYEVSTSNALINETNSSVIIKGLYWFIPLSGLVDNMMNAYNPGFYNNLMYLLFSRAPPVLFDNFYQLESRYTSVYYIPPTITPSITLTIKPPSTPPSPSPVFRLYKPSLSSPVGFLAVALFAAIFIVMSPVLGYLNALWLTMGVVLVYGLVVRDTYLMLIGFLGIVGAPMLRYIRSG